MKTWMKPGAIVLAIVLAISIGAGTYAMTRGGDDGDKTTTEQHDNDGSGNDVAGICLEGDEECVDTFDGAAGESCLEGDTDCTEGIGDGSGAAGSSCLAGATDCGEGIGDGQPLVDPAPASRCLPEAPDCDDTIDATGGGSLGMCAPGVTDCVDVAVCDEDGNCVAPEPCKEIVHDNGTVECALPDETCIDPVPAQGNSSGPVSDPDAGASQPGEPGQTEPGAPSVDEPAPPPASCVPAQDPCAIPPDATAEIAEAIARRCEEMQGGGTSSNPGAPVAP
jgi:hypothetical protein